MLPVSWPLGGTMPSSVDRRQPHGAAATPNAPGVIDWSYELLPDAEQKLLCRLAVFCWPV